ncbi:MAG: GNAT family N-acetyltransferase [Dongiaceae bacterium]
MKEIFRQIWQDAKGQKGWDVLELPAAIAFRSPVTDVGAFNSIWGEPDQTGFEKIKKFQAGYKSFWYIDPQADTGLLPAQGLKLVSESPEMVLPLVNFAPHPLKNNIRLIKAGDEKTFACWKSIAAEAFAMALRHVALFCDPFLPCANAHFYLAELNGVGAAVGMGHVAKQWVGIFFIATLPEFRQKGLGRAVTEACLLAGKNSGAKSAVLYSSPAGLPLYQRLGFQETLRWNEYSKER